MITIKNLLKIKYIKKVGFLLKTFIKDNLFTILISLLLVCYLVANCIFLVEINRTINEYNLKNIENTIDNL